MLGSSARCPLDAQQMQRVVATIINLDQVSKPGTLVFQATTLSSAAPL